MDWKNRDDPFRNKHRAKIHAMGFVMRAHEIRQKSLACAT